jgi:hypothetical protein
MANVMLASPSRRGRIGHRAGDGRIARSAPAVAAAVVFICATLTASGYLVATP